MKTTAKFLLGSALVATLSTLVAGENLYEALTTNGLDGFKALVDAESTNTIRGLLSGLNPLLSPLTLFAPSEAGVLAANTYPEALGWYQKQGNEQRYIGLLAGTIFNGAISAADAIASATGSGEDDGSITSILSNLTFALEYNETSLELDVSYTTVEVVDIAADNGVMHVTNFMLPFPTLIEGLLNNPDFSLVTSALVSTSVYSILQAGNVSLFTPATSAFIALGFGPFGPFVQALLTPSWYLHLDVLLLNHVVDGFLFLDDVADGDTIMTKAGTTLTITKEGDDTFVSPGLNPVDGSIDNAILITLQDGVVQDGVGQFLNGLITAPYLGTNVLEVAEAAGYTEFVKLVTAADITNAFLGFGLTVHAPTNAAIAALDADIVEYLTSAAGKQDLIDIIHYHVINIDDAQLLPWIMIPPGSNSYKTLHTLQANVTGPAGSDAGAMYMTATIIRDDMPASNGIVRGIDAVVIPSDYVGNDGSTSTSNAAAGQITAAFTAAAAFAATAISMV